MLFLTFDEFLRLSPRSYILISQQSEDKSLFVSQLYDIRHLQYNAMLVE